MTLYCINRFIIKPIITIPVLNYLCRCHVNDYFGGIIFCAYLNSILICAKRETVKNLGSTIIIMIFVGVIWEYIFPLLLPYSTSDFFDVISYVLGGITYYFIKKYKKLWQMSGLFVAALTYFPKYYSKTICTDSVHADRLNGLCPRSSMVVTAVFLQRKQEKIASLGG